MLVESYLAAVECDVVLEVHGRQLELADAVVRRRHIDVGQVGRAHGTRVGHARQVVLRFLYTHTTVTSHES